jgi:hypothetical protein
MVAGRHTCIPRGTVAGQLARRNYRGDVVVSGARGKLNRMPGYSLDPFSIFSIPLFHRGEEHVGYDRRGCVRGYAVTVSPPYAHHRTCTA